MVTPYYQDDYVTLYHGDCLTEHREWLEADLLVTDPPYGVAIAQNSMSVSNGVQSKTLRKPNAIAGDENTDARDAALAAWGTRPAIVFGTWRAPRPAKAKHRLIWHKANTHPGISGAPWFPADEEIYVLGSGFIGPAERNVYTTNELRSGEHGLAAATGHPTPKPVGLMEQLIRKCPPGVIADPFAGSGATLLAAKAMGRKCIGVELEEKYCQGIAQRLSQGLLELEWTA